MRFIQKIALIVVLALVALFLQSSILELMIPSTMVPNLCILLVMFLAFHEATVIGAFLAFMIGLLFDFSSGTLVGPAAGAFVSLFGILALMSRRVFIESVPSAVVLTAICCLGADVIYMSLLYQFKPTSVEIWKQLLLEPLFTAAVAPPILSFLRGTLVRRTRLFTSRGVL